MINFGTDSGPIALANLPGPSDGLDWYNNNRKRLVKFAKQYVGQSPAAVAELKSQGQTDTTNPQVIASRQGFNEMRVRLPVLNQYYEYSLAHHNNGGGEGDATYLAQIKKIVLAWVQQNVPTGKPIDETNFENLLKVIQQRWADFSASEQADITAWVSQLRTIRADWDFAQQPGEGALTHGNHYTHHYKILLLAYQVLGETAAANALLTEIDEFATRNLPFGNPAMTYPLAHPVVGASVSGQRFDIDGNYLDRFVSGHSFTIIGNSQGNDGTYTVSTAQYLSSSDKTRIFTVEVLAADGGGGTLQEIFEDSIHDMPRPATAAGESIDYLRRDALHYHQYDLEPWLEIAIAEGGSRYQTVCEQMFAFLEQQILNPPVKHYEFANSTDPFDALRWEQSRSEYLQPEAMYIPDKAARVIFAYQYYQDLIGSNVQVDPRLMSFALRSDVLPSHWYYYFRWVFGGQYG